MNTQILYLQEATFDHDLLPLGWNTSQIIQLSLEDVRRQRNINLDTFKHLLLPLYAYCKTKPITRLGQRFHL